MIVATQAQVLVILVHYILMARRMISRIVICPHHLTSCAEVISIRVIVFEDLEQDQRLLKIITSSGLRAKKIKLQQSAVLKVMQKGRLRTIFVDILKRPVEELVDWVC